MGAPMLAIAILRVVMPLNVLVPSDSSVQSALASAEIAEVLLLRDAQSDSAFPERASSFEGFLVLKRASVSSRWKHVSLRLVRDTTAFDCDCRCAICLDCPNPLVFGMRMRSRLGELRLLLFPATHDLLVRDSSHPEYIIAAGRLGSSGAVPTCVARRPSCGHLGRDPDLFSSAWTGALGTRHGRVPRRHATALIPPNLRLTRSSASGILRG